MVLGFSKTWPWNGEPTNFIDKIKRGEKIHTIREDKHERWREGMDIHFATGVRTPDYNQFHGDVCTGVQDIRIEYNLGSAYGYSPVIFVDDEALGYDLALLLALSDGFDDWKQFEEWFDEDFEGRLIHWTDMRY